MDDVVLKGVVTCRDELVDYAVTPIIVFHGSSIERSGRVLGEPAERFAPVRPLAGGVKVVQGRLGPRGALRFGWVKGEDYATRSGPSSLRGPIKNPPAPSCIPPLGEYALVKL